MPIYVNEEILEDAVIQQEMDMLLQRYSEQLSPDELEQRKEDIAKDAKENAIERLILVQNARKEIGPIPTLTIEKRFKAVKKEMGGDEAFYKRSGLTKADDKAVLDDLESQIQYEDYLTKICKDVARPTRNECQAFYDGNQEVFKVPENIRASHIVQQPNPSRDALGVYSELMNLRQKILEGLDFAAVAQAYSECEDEGGDLGYFPRGQMVEAFDRAVFDLKVGEMSDVFTTEFGYHLVKVTDRIPEHVQPFDKVREAIEENLLYEKKNEKIGEVVDLLRGQAVIKEA